MPPKKKKKTSEEIIEENRQIDAATLFPEYVLFTYNKHKQIGPNNWPNPNELVFADPDPDTGETVLKFTRQDYAENYRMVTRYEYCVALAKKHNNWSTLKGPGRKEAIYKEWRAHSKGMPVINTAQYCWENYCRDDPTKGGPMMGAQQKALDRLEEYYGGGNHTKAACRSHDFPDIPAAS